GASGLFGMNMHYMEENDDLEAEAQYNGNMAWMEWSVPYEHLQQYGFTYDPHDRLVQAKYRAFEKEECEEKNTGAYDVYINEYDQLGNILELQRFGMTGMNAGVPTYGMIDNLEYTYNETLVNRLVGISDHSMSTRGFLGATGETFGYSDGVGNITSQSNIGLESAEYNFLDLPKEFEFSTGTIHNYYTADGQKLMSVTDETNVGLNMKMIS
ncbi:MAG TPA: hypothetical protein VI603_00770, partial [Saprospiraceae bacterium]|nr:hypothetical protein [Saprospiraceae bacterium]